MKKSVILILLLILLSNISFAYEEKIYIYGSGLIASKESNTQDINYYHQDYLSSNRIVTDNNGEITGKNTQEPYGADFEEKGTKEALENDYKYTGKEEDNSLYYFGARYYEPSSGRFISVDPAFDASISPYSYANNNPLKYVDPDGRQSGEIFYYNKELLDYGPINGYFVEIARNKYVLLEPIKEEAKNKIIKETPEELREKLNFDKMVMVPDWALAPNYDGLPVGDVKLVTAFLRAIETLSEESGGLLLLRFKSIGRTYETQRKLYNAALKRGRPDEVARPGHSGHEFVTYEGSILSAADFTVFLDPKHPDYKKYNGLFLNFAKEFGQYKSKSGSLGLGVGLDKAAIKHNLERLAKGTTRKQTREVCHFDLIGDVNINVCP